MKVLHVMPSIARTFGGPTRSVIGYARSSLRTGATVTIAAPATDDAPRFRAALPDAEVRLFAAHGRGAFIMSTALIQWLRHAARSHDVVHVHGLFNPISSLAARVSAERGVCTIIRPFGTLSRYTFEHRRRLLKRAYYRYVDKNNLAHAAAIHFTTATERDEASRLDAGFRDRGYVVPPPWVAEGPVVPLESEPSGRTILFLSRLDPVKRVENLLDAWPAVHAKHPDARLVIAGDGEARYTESLASRARKSVAGDSVDFVGFVTGDQKARLLANAAAFVLPSRHENFGIALLEALAAGLPAVIAPEVQLSSFVREHQLGIVTEATPDALASAINETLADEPLRARCRTTAPRLVAHAFSEEATGARLDRMYAAALHHTST